jgi:predicted PurR-regulated permease PerM
MEHRFVSKEMAVASILSKTAAAKAWQRALITLSYTLVGVVVIGFLYWVKALCIPIALALLLTFVLRPVVFWLQEHGFGRMRAVLSVVLIAALLLGGVSWVVGREVQSLLVGLPNYSKNIEDKIRSFQNLTKDNGLGKVIRNLSEAWNHPELAESDSSSDPDAPPSSQTPTSVVVEKDGLPWLAQIPPILGSVLEGFGKAGLAIVLTVFMLLKREDLRNRFIRLVGHGLMTVTTKAVDDASQRISRYLLMQFLLNGTLGLLVALGLSLIGVKYAILCGFLMGMMRYVPYVGSPVAAILPIGISLIQFEGWLQPLLVLGLIIGLEFVTNSVAEPRFYGRSIGVSEVGMLIAAAFWAFLWGPIGLVLSGPMTVCLVILGKYVPQLEFFDVLLGDGPGLNPRMAFYQRLTAMDPHEASRVIHDHMEKNNPDLIYDEMLVPALVQARRDRGRGLLTDDDEKFMIETISKIVEDIGGRQKELKSRPGQDPSNEPPRISILGIPAGDETDFGGLRMLGQLLDPAKWKLEIGRVMLLSSELLSWVGKKRPEVVCIGSMAPGGLAHTRYLCKRIRKRYPRLKIVVSRWGLDRNQEKNQQAILEAGANHVSMTLLETRDHLHGWQPIFSQENGAKRRRKRVKEEVE